MSRSSIAAARSWAMPRAEPRHLLILGGTAEARSLAAAASTRFAAALRVTTSLAGRTRNLPSLAGEVRRGGFGGAAGLAAYLDAARIDLVIDATHPFAARITAAAAEACAARGVPLLGLARPPWIPQAGDRWIEVADAAEAAIRLPELGRCAFLTIGSGALAAFSQVAGVRFLVRLIEAPAAALPLADYELILGRGPFTFAEERLIMTRHGVDVLIAKASGGTATAAKLEAARALGIAVLMLRRPPRNGGPSVASVDAALAWIEKGLTASREGMS